MDIFHDNGAAFGRRTRFFRDCATGGVEWMYGVDYSNGCNRWYCFHPAAMTGTVKSIKAGGMFLSRLENAAA